jgi:uncharacterized protein (DUF2164 family)
MAIELDKELRKQAIASIERYFEENMEERIGNLQAGALLGFFLEEIGPAVYNRAVADVQERLQLRVAEVDLECHLLEEVREKVMWPARPGHAPRTSPLYSPHAFSRAPRIVECAQAPQGAPQPKRQTCPRARAHSIRSFSAPACWQAPLARLRKPTPSPPARSA